MEGGNQNISELSEKIKVLEEENRTLKNIIHKAPIPLFAIDKDHRITHFNQAMEELTGLSATEMKGTKNQWRAFYNEERPVMADLILDNSSDAGILKHYGSEKRSSEKENRQYAATDFYPDLGEEGKWLYFTAAAIENENKHNIGAVETLQDVTEEKWLEANNRMIMRISAALPEYTGLEELMDYISKEVKDVLNSEGAIVLLYDEIRDELFFTGASYDNIVTEKRARKIRFQVDSIMAGRVVKTGRCIMENDPEVLKRDYPERDEKLGYKTNSLLIVPIKSDGRIIGVLCAINKKQGGFDTKDQELMTMIAGACAISIENARFSDALKSAYMEVASMNRAKGKAINHLSHELKTPAAILAGSFKMVRKKTAPFPEANVTATLDRIERSLNRIIDIQTEVADIMEDKTYAAQKLLINMFDICKDELETLIEQVFDNNRSKEEIESPDGSMINKLQEGVRSLIDQKFGPRSVVTKPIDFQAFLFDIYPNIQSQSKFRNIDINLEIASDLPIIDLPEEIIEKMVSGLIKNAVENTPDHGKIDISAVEQNGGILFKVHDFGVGIEPDAQTRIFEGFFATQETLLYSSKEPFSFNAGGKGADLLRMKIFSGRHGFDLKMRSSRCCFLQGNEDASCPGNIKECSYCKGIGDCIKSGGSVFSIFFPNQ